MPLTGFPGTETEPNWQAASEQSALLLSLQNTSPDEVIKELGVAYQPSDVAELVNYVPDFKMVSNKSKNPALFDGSDGAPRYLCFFHAKQYWLLILGSYTSEQWLKNCLGVVAQRNFPGTTVPVHKFWYDMAETLWRAVQADAGDMGDTPINIVGHSLGGAVAYNVALLAKQDSQFRPVRLMTFGSPRPVRGVMTARAPSFHYDVQTFGDVVPRVPPNIKFAPAPYWDIQGNPSVVKQSGLLAPAGSQLGELDVLKVTEYGVEPHPIGTYAKWLKTRADAFGPTPTLRALLVATGQIVGEPLDPLLRPPGADQIGPDLGVPRAYRPLQPTPQICR